MAFQVNTSPSPTGGFLPEYMDEDIYNPYATFTAPSVSVLSDGIVPEMGGAVNKDGTPIKAQPADRVAKEKMGGWFLPVLVILGVLYFITSGKIRF